MIDVQKIAEASWRASAWEDTQGYEQFLYEDAFLTGYRVAVEAAAQLANNYSAITPTTWGIASAIRELNQQLEEHK